MADRNLEIKSESVLSQLLGDLAVQEDQAARAVSWEVIFMDLEDAKGRMNAKLIARKIRKIVKISIPQAAVEADSLVGQEEDLAAAQAAVSLLMNVWRIARSI